MLKVDKPGPGTGSSDHPQLRAACASGVDDRRGHASQAQQAHLRAVPGRLGDGGEVQESLSIPGLDCADSVSESVRRQIVLWCGVVCQTLSFPLRPNAHIAVLFKLNLDDDGATTHRTILDVFLSASPRWINRDHDLFATGVTDVACFVLHKASVTTALPPVTNLPEFDSPPCRCEPAMMTQGESLLACDCASPSMGSLSTSCT